MALFNHIQNMAIHDTDRLRTKATDHYFRDALVTAIQRNELTPSQLQHAIFAHMPGWVSGLMSLRNRLVKAFGFEVGQSSMAPQQTQIQKNEMQIGETAGFLTVVEKYDDEIICCAEDKHMTFYLSVAKRPGKVVVSTLVNQKTLLGRIYVNAILPFHYIIARVVINNAVTAKRI